MRLSDAIALGRTLALPWERGQHDWTRGCAMQLAALAANGNSCDWNRNLPNYRDYFVFLPCGCKPTNESGPNGLCLWIEPIRFDDSGRLPLHYATMHLFNVHVYLNSDWTLDQLIDWVRANEPPEPPQADSAVPVQANPVEVEVGR